MFGSIFRDAVHPPLHYVVVKMVLYSGAPGIWAIRIPSIAAGLGTVFVLSRFALRYPEQRGAIYAAMLGCAVNDQFLRAMQMGRAYALETFLIVLLLYMVLDPVPRPQIILVVAAALAYTHYLGVLYALGICLVCRDRQRLKSLVIGASSIVLWLPLVLPVFADAGTINKGTLWQPIPTYADLSAITLGWIASCSHQVFSLAVPILLIGLAIWSFRAGNQLASYAATLAFFTPALTFLLTRWPLEIHIFIQRYYLPSVPFAMVLVAMWSIRVFRVTPFRSQAPWIVAALLLAMNLPCTMQAKYTSIHTRYDLITTDMLAKRFAPVTVYTTDPNFLGPLFYYCPDGCVFWLPPQDQLGSHFWFLLHPHGRVAEALQREGLGSFRVLQEIHYPSGGGPASHAAVVELERP